MDNLIKNNMREISPRDIYRKLTPRKLISSVMIPSQYQSYSICVEYVRDWFIGKFSDKYFNNVHVDGKYAFDDFNRFSITDEKLKRVNPLLAIFPTIQTDHNRDWIDSNPEIPLMLRRTKMEGCFFNDTDNGSHVQIIFKTILMNFTFKIRLNTRAEQLDLCEFIKLNHRAGYTQSDFIPLDIHVPKALISQIASDNGFELDENNNPKKPIELLKYLNTHSVIPFLYKYRCSNGNNEYFIKVPNCCAHLKTEMPSLDDGERVGVNNRNYSIEFQVEAQMTAPYSYTYYSQTPNILIDSNIHTCDGVISIMKSAITNIPDKDENGWDLYASTEYIIDESGLGDIIEINLAEYLEGTDLKDIINITVNSAINPKVFLNFKIFNDAEEQDYDIDWFTLNCKLKNPAKNITYVIATYIDMSYVNDTLINIKEMNKGRIN